MQEPNCGFHTESESISGYLSLVHNGVHFAAKARRNEKKNYSPAGLPFSRMSICE